MGGEDYNSVYLTGKISSISDEKILPSGKKYRFFDICQNEKYLDNNNTSYFSARITEEQFNKYNSLLKIGNTISLKGKIKSYITKDMVKKVCIHPEDISIPKPKEKVEKISYDIDGVMLWNGKRCEGKFYELCEFNEIEELLKEYKQ